MSTEQTRLLKYAIQNPGWCAISDPKSKRACRALVEKGLMEWEGRDNSDYFRLALPERVYYAIEAVNQYESK